MFLCFIKKEAMQQVETQCASDMLCFTAAECCFWQIAWQDPDYCYTRNSASKHSKGVAFPCLTYLLLTTAALYQEKGICSGRQAVTPTEQMGLR